MELYKYKNLYSTGEMSFLDISTGEFLIAEGSIDYIEKLLENFDPSEILISKQKKLNFLSKFNNNFQLFFLEDWVYQYDFAIESLCNHFNTKSLKGFGVEKLKDGLVSAGAIMHYLNETQHQKINHITSINRIPKDDYIWMDGFTIKNLEIFHSFTREGKSLIDVIDKTISVSKCSLNNYFIFHFIVYIYFKIRHRKIGLHSCNNKRIFGVIK